MSYRAPAEPESVVAELIAYIGLDSADRARLIALHAWLAPELAAMADRFYDRVRATAAITPLLGSGSSDADRMRALMVDWMASGLLGPYDARFEMTRSAIGRRHVEIGLPQHVTFAATSRLRDDYDERIAAHYEPAEARPVSRSVAKLLDVELALIQRHYQLDSEARLVEREQRSQAERIQAIQTLSAGLAHEVRNPLNSAKLQLELLERRLRRDHDDPKLLVPVELVHHEIERLTRMLGEFLAFARPVDLALGDHDVVAIARDIVAAEGAIAARCSATLELAPHPPVFARVDAVKVSQILRNLVRNALEAVTGGGRVTIAVREDDADVHLQVEDDGPGIPSAIRGRIYEPFFSTKDSGTGLGMSIVHSLVMLHGGTIDLHSSADGTRFDVALPRRG